MQLSEITDRLQDVRKRGNQHMALCPAHSDKNASLSIAEKDGRILLKCFAGCDTDAVCEAIGISSKDLFIEKRSQPQIVATYDYFDENGTFQFQTVRYEPKDFRQRHREGAKWVWNLNGQKRVLYNLKAVQQSDTVYIVEGEKDVHAMGLNGFTATCNPMGAGKWRSDYNEHLRGKTVVIIPDNDGPGQKHAEQVANELHGIAKEVIKLPELPGAKDATEFFQNGGTADGIIGLVERAEPWQPLGPEKAKQPSTAPTTRSVLTVKTFNEWIDGAKSRPIPKMLFGAIWLQFELCILFGPTGRGKTALAIQIIESIASGKAIPGFDLGIRGLRVLYLDCELSDKQFEGRYASKPADSDYYVNHYKFPENCYRAEIDLSAASIDSPKQFEEELQRSIGLAIAENEIDVVVVDNITWLRDETEKARAALPLMKSLVDLKKRLNVSILVLAHTPKRDMSQPITLNHLQGSAVLANFADSIFAISESVKDPGVRYLKQLKVRSAEIVYGSENVKTGQLVKDENFLRFEFGEETPEAIHLKQLTEQDLANRRQQIAELHAERRSQREIARELGISISTVNKYVKQIECSPCSPRSQGERTNEQDKNQGGSDNKSIPTNARSFVPSANDANTSKGANRGEQGRTSANASRAYGKCPDCSKDMYLDAPCPYCNKQEVSA